MSLKKSSATPWPVYLCLHTIGLFFALLGAGAVQALSVDLQANPLNVTLGGSSTLKWTSSGAKWCYGGGYLGGSRPLNGTFDTGRVWEDRWYKITCSDGNREVSDGVMVRVDGGSGLSVELTANPQSVAMGGSSTLTWKSSGAKWCWGGGYLGGSRPVEGTFDTGRVWQNRWYKITCSDGSREVSDAVTVAVGSGQAGLSVDLTANPQAVAMGGSSTLSWKSSGAKWCWGGGYLGGSRPLNGTFDTGRVWENRWYKITCSDGSREVSDALTVTINDTSGTDVSVRLDADPRQIRSGESSTLKWSSQGATSCTASGGWSGGRALSGSFTTGGLSKSTSYSLTCQNGSRSAWSSVTVQVDTVPVVRWQAPTENVDGTPLTDLAGYRFYWGTSSRRYLGSATINNADWTQFQPSHLASGRYYVAVTAIDADGHESAYSNEIQITVP